MKKSLNALTIVSSILFVIFAGLSIGAAFISKAGFEFFFGEFFTCWIKTFFSIDKWFTNIDQFVNYWGTYASLLALIACITFIVLTIVLSCHRKQGKKSFWSFLYFGGFLPAILIYAVGQYPSSYQDKSIFLYVWDLANNGDALGKVLGWSLIIVPIVLIGFVVAHFVLLMVSLSKKYANAVQNEEIKEEEYVPYAANEAAYEEQAEPELLDEEIQGSEIKNEVSTENEEDESMDIKALTESIKELVKEIVKEELEKQKVERHDFPPAGGPLVVQYFNGGINGAAPATQVVPVPVAPVAQPAPAAVPAPQPAPAPVVPVVKPAPVVEQPKAKSEPKPIKKVEPKVEEKVEEPKPVIEEPVKEEPIIIPVEEAVAQPVEEVVEETRVEEPVTEEAVEEPVVEQPVEEQVEEPVAQPAAPVDEYDPYIDVFGSPNPNKEPAPAVVPVVPVAPAPEAEEDEEGEKKVYERISFTQRMKESDKELQDHYSELKNDILAYGVKSRISNSGDTFRLHTKTFVKITIAGKALKLYFALDPKAYENTTLPIGDASHKGSYEDIPLFFKVKSELSMRRAKQLILDAMTQDGLVQTEIGTTDWVSKLDSEELGEDED